MNKKEITKKISDTFDKVKLLIQNIEESPEDQNQTWINIASSHFKSGFNALSRSLDEEWRD